jgi:hypothetical protein
LLGVISSRFFERTGLKAKQAVRPFFSDQGEGMIIGMLLMIIGGVLVTRNRNLAMLLAREPHIHQWAFMSSVARQNIAIIGTIFFVGGLVFFVLF